MKNEKGQSFIEFIIFLPFLIILFGGLVKIQGAINSSINQQKSVRGYFFSLLRNNSMLPDRGELQNLMDKRDIANFGLTILGWKDYSSGGSGEEGANPFASCFEITGFAVDSEVNDKCEDAVPGGANQLKNIRVYTAFGMCSANYIKNDDNILYDPRSAGSSGACQNQ